MVPMAPPKPKINTKTTQPPRDGTARRAARRGNRATRGPARVSGETRDSVRGPGRVVVELECGVTVYPPQRDGEPWRAVWAEDGRRRFREAVTEEKLAAKLEKVIERLQADAPNMERPGADLIAWYLSPDRRRQPWSRKHADTQRRLCARFVTPVISGLACQDIKTADMQRAVNAAPTDGEGERLRRCISALVTAGIAGGYLTAARLKDVHWQPGPERPAPPPAVSVAGESSLFVDPAQIPGHADVAKLGQALAVLRDLRDLQELMACTAAYSGLARVTQQQRQFGVLAGQHRHGPAGDLPAGTQHQHLRHRDAPVVLGYLMCAGDCCHLPSSQADHQCPCSSHRRHSNSYRSSRRRQPHASRWAVRLDRTQTHHDRFVPRSVPGGGDGCLVAAPRSRPTSIQPAITS